MKRFSGRESKMLDLILLARVALASEPGPGTIKTKEEFLSKSRAFIVEHSHLNKKLY